MLFYGIASGCEAIGGDERLERALYRTWYLTGAMWTAGWLGLGTTFLLSRTRFGYTFAVCLLLAGVFTLLTQKKFDYPGAGSAPILYLIGAVVLARRRGGRDLLPERSLAGARGGRPSSGRRSSRSS